MPHKRGFFLWISNWKLWKQFASTVSCFQRLSILGQFPAFLLHTSVHKALSITVPGTLSVWSSLFELSMEFSSKLRGRVAEDSYIPCSPLLVRCSLTTMHALAHWHSYIPVTLGGQRPSWVTKRQLSWGAVLSLRIIITPLSSTFRRSLSQFVLCHRGAGRVGVGQIGPRFAARVKNSPKNSQLLGLLTLTIDRFVTFSWFLRRVSCQHGLLSSSSSFHIYIFHALNTASKILTNASWNENFEYANNQLQKFS